MTTTVLDIVNGALKKLGITRKNETPDASESADALTVLNDMLASWSNDSLFITSRVLESFTLVNAQSSYQIYTGSPDFNTTRPLFIKAAFLRQNNVDYEMTIIDDAEFNTTISVKTISSTIPTILSYDNAYPHGTIKIWPVPTTTNTINLLSEKALTQFTSTTDTVDLPPGWSLALKSNLAMLIADEYNLQPTASLIKSANDSMAAIKRSVLKNKPIVFHTDVQRRYNIYADR